MYRSEKTKEKGFEVLRGASCGKVYIYGGKLMEDKGCFSKVCYVDSSWYCSWAAKSLELSSSSC